MALSGHQSIRMLERYAHPTNARKIDALETFALADGQNLGRTENLGAKKAGGRQEARTPDLRVAKGSRKRKYIIHRTKVRRLGLQVCDQAETPHIPHTLHSDVEPMVTKTVTTNNGPSGRRSRAESACS